MSQCVDHIQCPACAKLGKDRNGNNLAVYDDGSKYCFSCHYYVSASGFASLKGSSKGTGSDVRLPPDVDEQLPEKARHFLRQYALTELDIQRNTMLWSDYHQRLYFPYFTDSGLVAYQGRYLGDKPDRPKWYSQGNLHEFHHVVGNTKADTVVLTEDIISAIVVGHVPTVCASPIFGSHVSMKRLLQLKYFYDNIVVWLDFDKAQESMKVVHNAQQLGLNILSIITKKDPKEYSNEKIRNLLPT